MAEDGECKRPTEIGASGASRLPIATTEMVKSSITDGGSLIQEIDMNNVHLDAGPQTGTSHKRIMKGVTYEIDQKNLPPEAPSSLKSVRAVLVSEKTRLRVTIDYPSSTSLENFFQRFPEYATQDLQHSPRKLTRYTIQMRHIEPLMGTKPDLDESFDMAPGTAESVLLREISCTESLHQSHLKSFWLMAPDSTQSSEANFREGIVKSDEQPRSQKRPSSCAAGGGPEDQVTQDLCNNFEKWVEGSTQDTERVEQNQCKKTRMAPKDLIRPGMMIPVQEQPNCITVNFVHPHHIEPSQHGQSLCHVFLSEKHGDLKRSEVVNEGSLQWGFKKKVNSSGMNREFDMSKVQDMTGVSGDRSRKIYDLYKRRVLSSDDEVNLIPYNFMQSNRGPWTASLPSTPSSNDFYTVRPSTSRGLKRALSSNILSLKEKPKKQLASNRSPVNMLKLPKDMQGRWSTERYKSAQLKLIDIMHERKAAPGRPILRPALREEARKHIGDTGLLDHLLKHMTDTVVSTGERFRRRHNADGAMEYWLEDASLMEIRKAAGVEDPSWLPPQGWKSGDDLPGGPWEFGRGMSSSEAAEMQQLKENVEKLKSDMRFLCGRLTGFKREGALHNTVQVSDVNLLRNYHVPTDGDPERSREELDQKIEVRSIQTPMQFVAKIRLDVEGFRSEMTKMAQQQYDKDLKTNLTLERFQRLEEEAEEIPKWNAGERTENQNELPATGRNDLERQLAGIRKEVNVMQADIQSISNILGFPQHMRTPSADHLCRSSNGTNILLSAAGEERAPATSVILTEFETPAPSFGGDIAGQCEPFATQSGGVNSATSSSADGGAQATKVTTPFRNIPAIMVSNTDGLNSVTSISSPAYLSLSQKDPCTPSGYKVCRPQPGNFLWPNTITPSQYATNQYCNPAKTARREDYGHYSPNVEQTGLASTTSSPESSSRQSAARSSAKQCHVAAAMAGMFGCMAQHQQTKPIKGAVDPTRHYMRTTFEPAPVHDPAVWTATNVEYATGQDARRPSSTASGRTPDGNPTTSPNSLYQDPSTRKHPSPPVSLSLSLTLGSRVNPAPNHQLSNSAEKPT